MLDRNLAELYGVETKVLKQAARRNIMRFPPDFMFELTKEELKNWRSQFVTSNSIKMGLRHLPMAFTEQGVAMLSGILNSDRAIAVNIQIMRTFTKLRHMISDNEDLRRELAELREQTDERFQIVFETLDQLLTVDVKEKNKIGFTVKEKVSKYRAIGTSALRQASNSDWFLSYIYEKLGMQVEVVSGDREAYFSFTGAVRDIDIESILRGVERFRDGNCSRSKVSYKDRSCWENVLVVDIGGGSSEFILGSYNCSVILTESIDMGCVRLTEKFINSNPPPIEDLNNMRVFIRKELKNTIEKIKKNGFSFIIGLAGTITTLAAIDLNLREYNKEKIHHHILSLSKIKQIYKNLCSLSLQERKKVIGLEPERADVIIGGTAVVLEIMELLEENIIVVSENDILNGIIYSLADF